VVRIETADEIDRELEAFATFREKSLFNVGLRAMEQRVYLWPWNARLTRNIATNGQFEFIQSAFRPDTMRVLKLLTGTQLYNDRSAAIRELLQNAFDSVRELIAHELLSDRSKGLTTTAEGRGHLHKVLLTLTKDGDDIWLHCADDGAGMSKRIIEQHMLVSAAKPRPELQQLRRRCKEQGIEFERSGEFGIGVLSYFLIAETIVIETRPNPLAFPDETEGGWRFEIEGVGSFGELRRTSLTVPGTAIRMRLRQDLHNSIIVEKLDELVEDLLIRLPCRFEYDRLGKKETLGPGWANSPDRILKRMMSQLLNDRSLTERNMTDWDGADFKKQGTLHTSNSHLSAAAAALKVFDIREGELPNGLGKYRVAITYFQLRRGNSRYYFNDSKSVLSLMQSKYHNKNATVASRSLYAISWCGILTEVDSHDKAHVDFTLPHFLSDNGVFCEIDLYDGASPKVDRDSLILEKWAPEFTDLIYSSIDELLQQFYRSNADSAYVDLDNAWSLFEKSGLKRAGSFWVVPIEFDKVTGEVKKYGWNKVKFPAVVLQGNWRDRGRHPVLNRAVTSEIGHELRVLAVNESNIPELSPLSIWQPDRICFTGVRGDEIGLVYEEGLRIRLCDLSIVKMPDSWTHILAVKAGGLTVFNASHLLVRNLDYDAFKELKKVMGDSPLRPMHTSSEQLGKLALRFKIPFLLECVDLMGFEEWEFAISSFKKFLGEVLVEDFYVICEDEGKTLLLVVGKSGMRSHRGDFTTFEGSKAFQALVRRPSKAWWYPKPV
jgi:hypothetical protein